MTWEKLIEQEQTSIGRPIRVVGRSVIRQEGIVVKTLLYKPVALQDPTNRERWAHSYRVSTWVTDKDGSDRHVGSTATDNEWKDAP